MFDFGAQLLNLFHRQFFNICDKLVAHFGKCNEFAGGIAFTFHRAVLRLLQAFLTTRLALLLRPVFNVFSQYVFFLPSLGTEPGLLTAR